MYGANQEMKHKSVQWLVWTCSGRGRHEAVTEPRCNYSATKLLTTVLIKTTFKYKK